MDNQEINFNNQEAEDIVKSLLNAKNTFMQRGKSSYFTGILITLPEVYPEDSNAISMIIRGKQTLGNYSRKKYKMREVDVSPNDAYDPNCPTCPDTNISDEVEVNDIMQEPSVQRSISNQVSLSQAQTTDDVMNFFGNDIIKAKQFLKSAIGITAKANWRDKTIYSRILDYIKSK